MILTNLRVVEEGHTGLICPTCDSAMTEAAWEKQITKAGYRMTCSACGVSTVRWMGQLQNYTPDNAEIGVTAESEKFLDVETARTSTWFHATARENWFEGINSKDGLLVHIGMKSTAEARISQLLHREGGDYYLWEIRLKETAQVNSDILDDKNEWPELVGDHFNDDYAGYSDDYEATRYVNRWETPGALSLLIQAGALEVVGMTEGKIAPLKTSH